MLYEVVRRVLSAGGIGDYTNEQKRQRGKRELWGIGGGRENELLV